MKDFHKISYKGGKVSRFIKDTRKTLPVISEAYILFKTFVLEHLFDSNKNFLVEISKEFSICERQVEHHWNNKCVSEILEFICVLCHLKFRRYKITIKLSHKLKT